MMENQPQPPPEMPSHVSGGEQQRPAEFGRENIQRPPYGLRYEAARAHASGDAEPPSEHSSEEPVPSGLVRATHVSASVDEYRMARDAAQQRVDRLIAKANLWYGSLHLAKNPQLAAKVRADAIAQARAEGFNVRPLEPPPPRGLVIPRPRPKAQRAHEELVAALKAHDRFMYSAKAREQARAASDHRAELEESIQQPLPLPGEVVEAAEGAPPPTPPEEPALKPAVARGVVHVPELIAKPPEGKRARIVRLCQRVGQEVALAPLLIQQKIVQTARRVAGYFKDNEKGDRRQGAALALGALGLAAAAAVLYLESRGHHAVCLPPKHTPPPTGHRPVPPPGTTPSPPIAPAPVPAHLTLGVHGDSIWHEVVGYAGSRGIRLNESQKNLLVDRVLQANGQTRESARHLPVGYSFTVDPQVLKGF